MTRAEIDVRVTATVLLLRAQDPPAWVSPDSGCRVYPETAATIIGVSVKTLRNWRAIEGHPLKYVPGTRVTYELWAILDFVYNHAGFEEIDA